jgi:hypothetical protein
MTGTYVIPTYRIDKVENSESQSMEGLEYGGIAVLCFVIYTLVDKVVAPLIGARSKGPSCSNGQRDINRELWGRLYKLENEHGEHSGAIAEVRADVKVSQAILLRIEKSIE